MKIDKELQDILLDLQKDTVRITDNAVTKKIKEIYKEEVDYAYNEFEPKSYKRRYDNKGFADESNWETDVDIKRNGEIEFTLTNETEAVNQPNLRLDQIIETGKGYNWSGEMPKERPIYERSQSRIEDEKIVENILESQLKKLGYDFK